MKKSNILVFITSIVLIVLILIAYLIDLSIQEKCLNTPFSEMKELSYCEEYWNEK